VSSRLSPPSWTTASRDEGENGKGVERIDETEEEGMMMMMMNSMSQSVVFRRRRVLFVSSR
jgi:hypothetical protein